MPETTTTADGGEEAPERFADQLVKATAEYRPLAVSAIRRAFEGRV